MDRKREAKKLIEVNINSFRYSENSKDILKDIRFSIYKGELVLFWGPNGSGKTTLCRLLTGISPYFISGDLRGDIVYYFEENRSFKLSQKNLSLLYEKIGILFQNPESQIISPVVMDELVFDLEQRGCPRDIIKTKVENVITFFSLHRIIEKETSCLSQGQKQILSLARLYASEPEILVLDEPLAFLDVDYKELIIDYIKKLKGKKTLIITTHHKKLIPLADRIILLPEGKEVSPKEIVQETNNNESQNEPVEMKRRCILQVNNLNFSYIKGEVVLEEISFKGYEGEIIWLAGPNGAGKSTLALLLSGLLPCQKGQIKIAGKDINEYKELNPQIVGIVFQNPDHQIFNTTIKEEIDFGLRFCNLEPHEIERREKEALSILPFVSDLKGDPRELSFGQKKFLNIVSIAVCKPKILILDEPDLAMDRNQEKFLIKLIQNLAKEGTFIIVISHNEGLISQYANRLLYLKNKLIYDGDPKKFTEIHQKIKNA